ncbi:hypothetical protein [Spirosoma daeguense]
MKNHFSKNQKYSRQQMIHQAIGKQVMAEHELERAQAVGWRKYWIQWKISMITKIRYRGIFFLGAATEAP